MLFRILLFVIFRNHFHYYNIYSENLLIICFSGMCDGKPVDWMDSNDKEISLWQRMLDRPNFWVEGCLTLRPSLELASKN